MLTPLNGNWSVFASLNSTFSILNTPCDWIRILEVIPEKSWSSPYIRDFLERENSIRTEQRMTPKQIQRKTEKL